MNPSKSKKIIYWALTILVAFVFLGSAVGKLTANDDVIKIASGFGLDVNTYTILGLVEIVSLILFIFPRTGILGTILLVAYMGGAIATHLEHNVSILAPCIVQAVTILVAYYRFPELRSKLLNAQQ